jgi:hypothetical protein
MDGCGNACLRGSREEASAPHTHTSRRYGDDVSRAQELHPRQGVSCAMEDHMAKIVYEIEPKADQWSVTRNGELGASYMTAEAAFEVAASQASIEMRSDHEIFIHIRPAAK